MRLDVFLSKNGYFDSRQKAKEALESGSIKINEKIITKPSFDVESSATSKIEILQKSYVSRAAYKLKAFLKDIDFQKSDFCAIDVGASRGGFSQVLLESGARQVYCVDVGKDQLHPSLKADSRILNFEDCDIRKFVSNIASKQNLIFDLLVCDVSFIGIENIFSALESLSKEMILLFKPQFEVGKNAKRNKKGVLKDILALDESMRQFLDFIESRGFKVAHLESSKLKGKEGNEEFFIHIKKH